MLTDFGFKINGSPLINNFNWKAKTLYSAEEVFEKPWPQLSLFAQKTPLTHPENIPLELTVETWFKQNEVTSHPNQIHHFKPRAGLARFLTIDEGDDLKKSFKRLHRWRYSPTAAYGNNEVHLHPYEARRISVSEALAIQSLPKEFVIPENISLTDMFKTIGNGVPFLAAKGLALTIIEFLYDNKVKNLKDHNE